MKPPVEAWDLPVSHLVAVPSGLINDTWLVWHDHTAVAVLQRLNTDVFVPEVHLDIEAVTRHLERAGVPTPTLIRTRAGGLWHTDDGGVFRCLTVVGERTIASVADVADAEEAAALVGRFHAALADFEWEFRSVRAGAHDTPGHLRDARAAVDAHPTHRLREAVAPVVDGLEAAWGRWQGPTELPVRVIHGDLKISNVRFHGSQALALIDLDTLAWDTLDVELGDAMRSWCNPSGEDVAAVRFELPIFAAAMRGYARGSAAHPPTDAEWRSIVPGTERIALELAARFARDALEERYFGWNPAFGGRGEHNLLRARGQLALATAVAGVRDRAEAAVARAR